MTLLARSASGRQSSTCSANRLTYLTSEQAGGTTKRNPETGAGNAKAIIWTVILLVFIYVSAMMVPPLINEYGFQDSIQDIARYASANRRSNDQVRQSVLDLAQKDDLPITADNIKVEGNAGNIHINVEYSVTVDLKFYQWTLNFHPVANNSALF